MHYSVLSIKIDDLNKIKKIDYTITNHFHMGEKLNNYWAYEDLIETYESESYKREKDFANYIKSIINEDYNTVLHVDKLPYKPNETFMDRYSKQEENE